MTGNHLGSVFTVNFLAKCLVFFFSIILLVFFFILFALFKVPPFRIKDRNEKTF